MVEVHLVAGEAAAAVGAGNRSQLAQKSRCRFLAPPNSIDLRLPIRGVVGDVVRSLVTTGGHASF